MSQFRHEILQAILRGRIIAILRGLPAGQALALSRVLVEEGISAIEVTMNTPGALDLIGALKREFGAEIVLGAGTVLDGTSAVQAILAGAEFLVSPNFRLEVVQAAHRHGKPAIPGAMTPDEISRAAEGGADLVKVFPAASLTPKYFGELRGPLSHIALVPTGGITAENARDFLDQGAVALGVGGALTSRSLIEADRWEELRALARELRRQVDRSPGVEYAAHR